MTTILNHEIGPVGYGLMGLTRPIDAPSQSQSFAAMNAALSAGANYWNGGDFYGTPERNSLHLLNEYFTKYPEKASRVLLAVKGARTPGTVDFDGSEKSVRRSVDECLRVLAGKKALDIFECARVDLRTPVEDTIGVLATLVQEGKIRGIGLSEVRAETIRRAVKVHPIAQVEVELSLWSTDILHNGVAETCAELSIPIIAYAPLSRGGLTTILPTKTSELPGASEDFPEIPRRRASGKHPVDGGGKEASGEEGMHRSANCDWMGQSTEREEWSGCYYPDPRCREGRMGGREL